MTARHPIPAEDIGHYLGFFGPVPWMLYALYLVYISYSALVLGAPTSHTPLSLCAFVVLLLALLLVVVPSRTPLPMGRVAIVLVVIVFATAAVMWQLPSDVADLGYSSWQYNPCDLLLFCLAIRARIAWAWIGQALMQATVALWSITTTGAPWHGLLSSYTQAFPLVACSVFAWGLHHTARQIVVHRAVERARVERDIGEQAADDALQAELRIVRELATPALREIAAQQTPDPTRIRVLEASLRDRIRNPALAVEPLSGALRDARGRGIDVLVLDDLAEDALADARREELISWAAEQVAAASGARLTLRVAHEGALALATLSSDGKAVARLEL